MFFFSLTRMPDRTDLIFIKFHSFRARIPTCGPAFPQEPGSGTRPSREAMETRAGPAQPGPLGDRHPLPGERAPGAQGGNRSPLACSCSETLHRNPQERESPQQREVMNDTWTRTQEGQFPPGRAARVGGGRPFPAWARPPLEEEPPWTPHFLPPTAARLLLASTAQRLGAESA